MEAKFLVGRQDLRPMRVPWYFGIVAALAALTLLGAACGDSEEDGDDGDGRPTAGGTATAVETPGDDGASSQLELTAKDTLWDSDELTAPAGQPLTIVLHNEDGGIEHNVALYTTEEDGGPDDQIFNGELFAGVDDKTYDVPALDPGEYIFICTVHPATMTGTLTAE